MLNDIGSIDAMGLSMTSEPSMTTRVGHGAAQSLTTATQFSPPCATSCTNQVNGNHPGTLAQDRDSGRLNAAPNGIITNNTYRCIGDASRPEHIWTIHDMEAN
jgi:hypothetical protein